MQPVIRPYDASDAEAVVDLSLRAWAPVFKSQREVLGTTIFDRLHHDWRSHQQLAVEAVLSKEAIEVWVTEKAGRIAGFVAVELNPERSIGAIDMIAVDPDFQSDGIGGDLTNFALARISEAGMAIAVVETGGDPGHAPARRTYEKAGFTLLPIARYFKAL